MEILKRTKGIDTRAKSGAIRGDVCFQLRDAVTGKVKFEERGHNMLTNGLNDAMNKCPLGLNKVDTTYGGIRSSVNPAVPFYITPIFSQLLGGVILFPSALGNDADVFFPSFSNTPTAYASMESYTQSDNKQGTFDSVASREVANGFMYQYSWGSAYGNGTIASLGLAPRNAHVWCKDPTKCFQPPVQGGGNWYQVQGYYKTFSDNNQKVWAMNDKYALVNDTSTSTGRTNGIRCFRFSPYNANIMLPYSANNVFATDTYAVDGVTLTTCIWKIDNIGYNINEHAIQIIGDYAYAISRNGTTFTVKKITLADGTIVSTDTYTYNGYSFGGTKPTIYDGYIYCGASTAGKIYKCSMSDTSVVNEISDGAIRANEFCYCRGTKWIYTCDGIIDGDTGTFVPFSSDFFTDQRSTPIYDSGMWLVNSGTNGIGALLKQWGLMTHYDLKTVAHKDNTQSMTLNYTITQV